MMAQPIMVVQSVKAVVPRKPAGKSSHKVRERNIIYEASAGPRELLESIVIQSQAAVKSLDTSKAPQQEAEMTEDEKRVTNVTKGKSKEVEDAYVSVSEENQKLLDFCRRIQATADAIDRFLRENKGDKFVQRLHASLPRIPTAASQEIYVDAGDTEESAKKAYVEWATRIRRIH
jgi:aspartate oxidase